MNQQQRIIRYTLTEAEMDRLSGIAHADGLEPYEYARKRMRQELNPGPQPDRVEFRLEPDDYKMFNELARYDGFTDVNDFARTIIVRCIRAAESTGTEREHVFRFALAINPTEDELDEMIEATG